MGEAAEARRNVEIMVRNDILKSESCFHLDDMLWDGSK